MSRVSISNDATSGGIMLLRTMVFFGVLLAAIWSPLLGQYLAIVALVAFAMPVAIVHEKIAPLSDKIGNAIGQPSGSVTLGLVVSIALAVATFCLVRAAFDQRRAEEYAGGAIAVLGMLAVAFSTNTASSFAGVVLLALRLTGWREPGVSKKLSRAP
jgi:NADH:ubiquinone oxidoreductase subunit 2 (subunit N)